MEISSKTFRYFSNATAQRSACSDTHSCTLRGGRLVTRSTPSACRSYRPAQCTSPIVTRCRSRCPGTRDDRKACELKQRCIDGKRPPHATERMGANSKKPTRGADHDLFCKVRGHEALSDDLRGLCTVVEQVPGPND